MAKIVYAIMVFSKIIFGYKVAKIIITTDQQWFFYSWYESGFKIFYDKNTHLYLCKKSVCIFEKYDKVKSVKFKKFLLIKISILTGNLLAARIVLFHYLKESFRIKFEIR